MAGEMAFYHIKMPPWSFIDLFSLVSVMWFSLVNVVIL